MNFSIPGAPKGGKSFGQNEKRADRETRMRNAFWANTLVLWVIGKFLSTVVSYLVDGVERTGSVAQALIDGVSFEIDSLTLPTGQTLEVNPPQVLSLKTISDKTRGWGCPACYSAHGSGVYPSRDVSEKLLKSTDWYYDPKQKQVFTISSTCYDEYVKAFGMANRIIPVPAKVKSTTPKEIKA
jgi:hypothetical protein